MFRLPRIQCHFVASFAMLLCATLISAAETVRVDAGNVQLRDSLTSRLEDESIWFSIVDEETLVVNPDDARTVIELMGELMTSVLPEGRHAAFPDEVHTRVIRELDRRGVAYRVVKVFNDEWVVWEEADTPRVEAILSDLEL